MNNNDFDKPMDLNERWTQCPCNGYDILIKNGDYVGAFVHDDMHSPVSRSRCERACACVNALRGVAEPEAAVRAAREAMSQAVLTLHNQGILMDREGNTAFGGICRKRTTELLAALALLTPAPSPDARHRRRTAYQAFAEAAERAGLFPRECNEWHWQINGGQYRANYYPSKRTIFVNGMAEGYRGGSDDAIRIAQVGPDDIGRRATRWPFSYRKERAGLLRRDPRCHWCKAGLTPKTATLDHKIPLGMGGSDQPDNFVIACERCNKGRGCSLGAPNSPSPDAAPAEEKKA